MTEDASRWCVLIPCSSTETWAVPQNCLAEVYTLHADTDVPPSQITWRGRTVPVIDLGGGSDAVWREPRRGAGLVAIFLGLKGDSCEYWGVAVRGKGLSVVKVSPDEVVDAPAATQQHATAAFRLEEVIYQVPNLDFIQKHMVTALQPA